MKTEEATIPIEQLEGNEGQLEGVPANPRRCADIRKLCQSLRENPEMLQLRELLVVEKERGKYVVVAGNQRLRALRETGADTAPCKVIREATQRELRYITLADNSDFGEFDPELLAEQWSKEEITAYGIPDDIIDKIFTLEDADEEGFTLPDGDKRDENTVTFYLSASQEERVKSALNRLSKNKETALMQIVSLWEEQKRSS